MAKPGGQRRYAYVLSVLAHGAIVAALTFSLPLSSPNRGAAPAQMVVPIETVMVDQSALDAAQAAVEAERQAAAQKALEEKQRADREAAERKRRDDAEKKRQQEIADEQERIRLDAEQKAKADAEKKRQAEEQAEREKLARQKAEEEKRKEEERKAEEQRKREALARAQADAQKRKQAELAREVAEAAAVEEEALRAKNAGLRQQWSDAIANKVQRTWSRPPNADSSLECQVQVRQLPSGDVVDAEVKSCNTTEENIIRSVRNAVLNASPLPPAPIPQLFEPVVIVTFRPTD